MKLSLEQVRHVARLAHLSLTAEEEQRFQTQLSAILGAMDELGRVDTSQVEPTSHAALDGASWREDVAKPGLPVEKALANAPAKVGSSFAVPKVIE